MGSIKAAGSEGENVKHIQPAGGKWLVLIQLLLNTEARIDVGYLIMPVKSETILCLNRTNIM